MLVRMRRLGCREQDKSSVLRVHLAKQFLMRLAGPSAVDPRARLTLPSRACLTNKARAGSKPHKNSEFH